MSENWGDAFNQFVTGFLKGKEAGEESRYRRERTTALKDENDKRRNLKAIQEAAFTAAGGQPKKKPVEDDNGQGFFDRIFSWMDKPSTIGGQAPTVTSDYPATPTQALPTVPGQNTVVTPNAGMVPQTGMPSQYRDPAAGPGDASAPLAAGQMPDHVRAASDVQKLMTPGEYPTANQFEAGVRAVSGNWEKPLTRFDHEKFLDTYLEKATQAGYGDEGIKFVSEYGKGLQSLMVKHLAGASAAMQNGNAEGAAKFLERAYSLMPDGQQAKITPTTGKDGAVGLSVQFMDDKGKAQGKPQLYDAKGIDDLFMKISDPKGFRELAYHQAGLDETISHDVATEKLGRDTLAETVRDHKADQKSRDEQIQIGKDTLEIHRKQAQTAADSAKSEDGYRKAIVKREQYDDLAKRMEHLADSGQPDIWLQYPNIAAHQEGLLDAVPGMNPGLAQQIAIGLQTIPKGSKSTIYQLDSGTGNIVDSKTGQVVLPPNAYTKRLQGMVAKPGAVSAPASGGNTPAGKAGAAGRGSDAGASPSSGPRAPTKLFSNAGEDLKKVPGAVLNFGLKATQGSSIPVIDEAIRKRRAIQQ